MKKPRFVDIDGKVYNADSCIPLNNAWKEGRIGLYTLARGAYPGRILAADELTGINNIGFWNAKKAQNWGLDWHRNEGIEICFLESGSVPFHIGNKQYTLTTRDLTITRPWLSHKLGDPQIGPCKLHWIILDVGVRHPHQDWEWPDWIILNPKDLDELTVFLRHNESPVWTASSEFALCFEQIGAIIQEGHPSYDTRLKILFNSVLSALLDIFRKGNVELNDSLVESGRTVELFLEELENHLIEEWSLESMAHHCNLGITQFTKYCKELTNLSPMSFLSSIRLKRAAHILSKDDQQSVTDIAYECGFSTPQYFATSFKRHYGVSPQAYRLMKDG